MARDGRNESRAGSDTALSLMLTLVRISAPVAEQIHTTRYREWPKRREEDERKTREREEKRQNRQKRIKQKKRGEEVREKEKSRERGRGRGKRNTRGTHHQATEEKALVPQDRQSLRNRQREKELGFSRRWASYLLRDSGRSQRDSQGEDSTARSIIGHGTVS